MYTYVYVYMLHVHKYSFDVYMYIIYIYIYIYIYILRTLTRHRRTSCFFEIWVLCGDAGFFAVLCNFVMIWALCLCPCGSLFLIC